MYYKSYVYIRVLKVVCHEANGFTAADATHVVYVSVDYCFIIITIIKMLALTVSHYLLQLCGIKHAPCVCVCPLLLHHHHQLHHHHHKCFNASQSLYGVQCHAPCVCVSLPGMCGEELFSSEAGRGEDENTLGGAGRGGAKKGVNCYWRICITVWCFDQGKHYII